MKKASFVTATDDIGSVCTLQWRRGAAEFCSRLPRVMTVEWEANKSFALYRGMQ